MDVDTKSFRSKLADFLKGDFSSDAAKRHFKQLEHDINEQSRGREAWPIVLKLLSEEDDRQVKYFASNILKDKFKFDYGQLTPELLAAVVPATLEVLRRNPRP